jgi:hypothetical protein
LSHGDIDELLNRYGGENGKGYLQPLATGFGAGLNSGLYSSARVKTLGIRFQFEVKGMMMAYSDDQKTFKANTSGHFYPPAEVVTPTVIGDGRGAEVTGEGGTKYHFPGGLEIGALYLMCPQLTVGSVFGTEATIRFVTFPLGEDLGTMSLWGLGFKHSLSQYFPVSPVDVAIGTFYQKLVLGEVLDASFTSVYLAASKSLPLFTLYGGFGWEGARMRAEYTFQVEDMEREIEFNLDGEYRFRTTVGVAINLFILNLNGDVSLGRQTVFSIGVASGI